MLNGKDNKDVMLEFWITFLEVGFEKLGRTVNANHARQHQIQLGLPNMLLFLNLPAGYVVSPGTAGQACTEGRRDGYIQDWQWSEGMWGSPGTGSMDVVSRSLK